MPVAMKDAESAGMDRAELKKSLKLARRMPMNVAFALDGDGKAIILCDKLKKGPGLFRQLRQDAPDSKNHRFGTVEIDQDNQKLAIFTVNKAGGGMARKMVKTLKGTGCTKVVIRLEDGTEVEVHEEEDESPEVAEAGGDDDYEADEHGEHAEPASPVDVAGGATAADANGGIAPHDQSGSAAAADPNGGQTQPSSGDQPQPTGLDATTLAADLTSLVKQMMGVIAADPTQKAALVELATDAQASLKRGDLQQASAAIDVLRQAMGSASDNSGQPSGDAQTATDPAADNVPVTSGADPNAAAAPAPDTTVPPISSGNAATTDPAGLMSMLTDLVKRMMPIIAADPSQQDALRNIAQQAQAGLKGGDADTAARHIEDLRALVDGWSTSTAEPDEAGATETSPNGATANGSGQPDAAAAAAPAIAKARMAWVATRQKVEGDLGKLHSAFGTAFKGHDQEDAITKAFHDRVETVLNALDDELAHTLEAVNNAKDPNERSQLLQQALSHLQRYQQHVASDPTIAAIDTNPFVPMAVQKTVTGTIAALMRSIQ